MSLGGTPADPMVVAIDGPAGSGKSTIAKRLATALGIQYLDTGAMYRVVTLAVLRAGLEPTDVAAVGDLVGPLDIVVKGDGTVLLDNETVTADIRTAEVNGAVSAVASHAGVRTELVARQRAWARARSGGVLEGRDIGTAVFPDAVAKIYLTASPEVRAARRAAEVGETDEAAVSAMAAELARRDALDSNRAIDPLAKAEGAIDLDTSDLGIDEVVDRLVVEVLAAAERRRNGDG